MEKKYILSRKTVCKVFPYFTLEEFCNAVLIEKIEKNILFVKMTLTAGYCSKEIILKLPLQKNKFVPLEKPFIFQQSFAVDSDEEPYLLKKNYKIELPALNCKYIRVFFKVNLDSIYDQKGNNIEGLFIYRFQINGKVFTMDSSRAYFGPLKLKYKSSIKIKFLDDVYVENIWGRFIAGSVVAYKV